MFATEDFWNDKFKNETYFYGTEPNEFLKNFAHLFKKDSNLLSLGDGEGRNAVFLAKKGFNTTSSDASSMGLEKLKKFALKENVSVTARHEDVVTGDWENFEWDGIINIFCHLQKEQRFIVYEKIKKSLKVGGIFLTEMFSVEQLIFKSGGPADINMLLDIQEFKDSFSDFKIIYADTELVELDEGRHSGKASVVRFIAQKN